MDFFVRALRRSTLLAKLEPKEGKLLLILWLPLQP